MKDKKFGSVTEALDDYHDRRRREIEGIIGTGKTTTSIHKPMSPEEEAKRDRYRSSMRASASNFHNDLSRFSADNPQIASSLPWELLHQIKKFMEFLGNEY